MSNPIKINSVKANPMKRFLSFISFQAPLSGIFFKITFVTVFYTLLIPVLKAAGATEFAQLVFWFFACGLIAFLDHKFISSSRRIYSETFKLEQKKEHKEAVELLKSISSNEKVLVPCPDDLYFSRLIELHIANSDIEKAKKTIREFRELPEVSVQSKISSLRITEAEFGAIKALKNISNTIEDPEYIFEKALLLLKSKGNYSQLKKTLQELLNAPDALHSSFATVHELSSALLEVSKLWTGHAEEGLENLNLYIKIFQKSAALNPAIKKFLALLYAERAFYLATHKEPYKAVSDITLSRAIGNSAYLKERIDETEQELLWRHDIEPSDTNEAQLNKDLKDINEEEQCPLNSL